MTDQIARDEWPFPSPLSSPFSQGFWDAARADRLVVQTCTGCGHVQYPPLGVCQRCQSDGLDFRPASGRGRIHITSAVWRPQVPDAPVPYIVAIAEMDEGWHLMCNLLDHEGEIPVGTPVRVVFRETGRNDGEKLPALIANTEMDEK